VRGRSSPGGSGRFAQALQQHLAPVGPDLRQGGGGTERAWQPRPRIGAEQALVQEPEGGEAMKPFLRQIESGNAGQLADETFDHVEAGLLRNRLAQCLEFLIRHILTADRGVLARITAPDQEGIAPAEPDIKTATDIALFGGTEAREFAHFGNRHRRFVGDRHVSLLLTIRSIAQDG